MKTERAARREELLSFIQKKMTKKENTVKNDRFSRRKEGDVKENNGRRWNRKELQ